MKLIKTTFFSAIISVVRLTSGFIAGKVIASLTGPAGVALVGQFTNFITIALTFSNGAINNGVIKYTAENHSKGVSQGGLFGTALKISLLCSGVIGVVLFSFSNLISRWVFDSNEYQLLIRVFSFCIILYALNTILVSILNGLQEIKTYTLVNTIGSITGLLLTLVLVFHFKIMGALYALVLSQSIVCLVTCFLLRNVPWFGLSLLFENFDAVLAKRLLSYSLMAIVSIIMMPLAQIIIRNYIISNLGIDDAGYWQAMMRVSDAYLMLLTTAFSTYYLPKLSSLHENKDLQKEVINGYKIITPILILSVALIFFLRFIVIKVLFTNEFLVMEDLFFYQLLGDLFKMSAWILSYLMLAKSMTKLYIATELLFGVSYVLLCFFFLSQLGIKGVVIAFSVNYLIYLLTMVFLFRKLLFGQFKDNEL